VDSVSSPLLVCCGNSLYEPHRGGSESRWPGLKVPDCWQKKDGHESPVGGAQKKAQYNFAQYPGQSVIFWLPPGHHNYHILKQYIVESHIIII
jgi:hypothetical protein